MREKDREGKDWSALGKAVRERRESLGLRQTDVQARGGPSFATVQNVEAGRPVRSLTMAQMDRGLGWPTGTAAAVADGAQPPVPVPDTPPLNVFQRVTDLVRSAYESGEIDLATHIDLTIATLRVQRERVA